MRVKFYFHLKYGENAIQSKELIFLPEEGIPLGLAKINITTKMKEKYPNRVAM